MSKVTAYPDGGRIQKTDDFIIVRTGENKRITGDKVEASPYGTDTSTEVSSATPSINVDQVGTHRITNLQVAITSFTTNLTGTPRHGQRLRIEIKDDGTPHAITWGAKFRTFAVSLPTTTIAGELLRTVFIYDSVGAVFDLMAADSAAESVHMRLIESGYYRLLENGDRRLLG